MDIKRMHDMIEKLSECAKSEFDKGIESVNTDEMGKVTDMLKDLAEAMYYRTLTNIMEEYDIEDVQGMLDRRFYAVEGMKLAIGIMDGTYIPFV